jgi:hypothetical protein
MQNSNGVICFLVGKYFNIDFPSSSDTLDFTSGEGVYCGLFYISVGLLGALLRYDGLLVDLL